MAVVLTLHQGDAERTFSQHPIEIARRALLEAADFEERSGGETSVDWAAPLRRFANALPERGMVA